ncbi:MAG: hypothetical protein U5L02_05295 [Rheinheimera sp.]|nr:hypothetical protein [Rheinheimera sp.]
MTITDNNTVFNISRPQVTLQADVTGANGEAISCAGLADGRIQATTTGAVGPLAYLWEDGTTNNTRSNLAAGNYSLTVTDAAGCTATTPASRSMNPHR